MGGSQNKFNYTVFAKAEIENCEWTHQGKDQRWNFSVECLNCGEKAEISFDGNMSSQLSKGDRSDANFVMKCKGCSKLLSIDYTDIPVAPYMPEDSGSEKAFAHFNAKHCKLVNTKPHTDFMVKMGAEFEVQTFDDGEFCDSKPDDETVMCSILQPKFIVR